MCMIQYRGYVVRVIMKLARSEFIKSTKIFILYFECINVAFYSF